MRLLLIFIALLVCVQQTMYSQMPKAFRYQAILRDAAGQPVLNQDVKLRLTLVYGDPAGLEVYAETHTKTTSPTGLVNLEVGRGIPVLGDFTAVDWSAGNYYLRIEVDPKGGDSYQLMGTSELLSVPYALYSGSGTVGPQGPIGPEGPAGPQGPQGIEGPQGPQGPQGNPGTGLSNRGYWNASTTYQPGDYVFDRSTTSSSANSMWILQASGAYQSASQPYQDPSAWIEFQAPPGPQGPQGPQGSQGIQGTQGVQGIQGPAGPTGPSGTSLTNKGTWISSTYNPGDYVTARSTLDAATNAIWFLKGSSSYSSSSQPYLDPTHWSELTGPKGSSGTSSWTDGSGKVTTTAKVGIGVSSPNNVLAVKGDLSIPLDTALFEVKDKLGQTVFAVYDDGVRVFVKNGSKGGRGGFAVAGRSPVKGGVNELLWVTPDSIRAYIDNNVKGGRGGFAVSGRSPAKGIPTDILRVAPDSVRIYLDSVPAKGGRGGFAVSGRTAAKGSADKYMDISDKNYFIGYGAGKSNTLGQYNSFMGFQSGYNNTISNENIFIGYQSGYSNKDGGGNVFIGNGSGGANVSGNGNTFLGLWSGAHANTGSRNVFLGFVSGYSNQADDNVFIGYSSGFNNATGTRNVFIGRNSGYSNAGGSGNVLIGNESGANNSGGSYNVYLGEQAGKTANLVSNNVYMGYLAGSASTSGDYNVAIGSEVAVSNAGPYNVFVGYKSGNANTSGSSNTFLGYLAGSANTVGYSNVFIGNSAGKSNGDGSSNTFLGNAAGYSNLTGYYNVFLGDGAGFSNTNGSNNVYLGKSSGSNRTGGTQNIFLGTNTGAIANSGSYNLFIGSNAGYSNGGSSNLFVGPDAGYNNVSGSGNVFIGASAGLNELGSNRLYISNNAGSGLIYGEFDNSYLRFSASVDVTTKLAVGKTSAGTTLDVAGQNWDLASTEGDVRVGTPSYRLKIGVANSGGGAGDVRIRAQGGTNNLILGSNTTDVLLVTTTAVAPWSDNAISSGASGRRWTAVYAANGVIQTSDARLKKDITNLDYGLTTVMQLKPVSYSWKEKEAGERKLGFIAQDLQKLLPEIVSVGNDPDGTLGINYAEIIPVLTRAIQEQQQTIQLQQKELNDLHKKLSGMKDLESRMNEMEKQLQQLK